MKLPNGEQAIVEIEKLRDYCLNPEHPRGRHKARVFASYGVMEQHAEALRTALLYVARTAEAVPGNPSPYGQRYAVDFEFDWNDRKIPIRSAWIVRDDEYVPRLTTCYVL